MDTRAMSFSFPNEGGPPPAPDRFFSLAEANRTLPLVRRIVQDIIDAYPLFQEKMRAFHAVAAEPGPETRRRLQGLREQIDVEADRINAYLAELTQIGCQFKGFQEGLVDFYTLHEGRPVMLCWKFGEDEITHWHEIDEGFLGRHPVTDEMRAG